MPFKNEISGVYCLKAIDCKMIYIGSSSKIKRIFANEMGERFLDNLLKNNKLIIKQVNRIFSYDYFFV